MGTEHMFWSKDTVRRMPVCFLVCRSLFAMPGGELEYAHGYT